MQEYMQENICNDTLNCLSTMIRNCITVQQERRNHMHFYDGSKFVFNEMQSIAFKQPRQTGHTTAMMKILNYYQSKGWRCVVITPMLTAVQHIKPSLHRDIDICATDRRLDMIFRGREVKDTLIFCDLYGVAKDTFKDRIMKTIIGSIAPVINNADKHLVFVGLQ
jgi:hypothetical protein